jgi:hypothetical protein
MINRALRAGVRMALIADPGRQPFYDLGVYFSKTRGAEILEWRIRSPKKMEGRILKIGSLSWRTKNKAPAAERGRNLKTSQRSRE